MCFRQYLFIFLIVAASFFAPAQAGNRIDRIVLFGDSLSDTGNLYSMTFHFVPKASGYYNGRFSNGLAWVEYLAKALKLDNTSRDDLLNYAYGGAWAEPSEYSKMWMPIPDLTTQVQSYLYVERPGMDIRRHLFVIWVGGNDYLGVGESPDVGRDDPEFATMNTIKYIESNSIALIKAGAKNLLFINMPDLSKTPFAAAMKPSYIKNEAVLAKLHNQKMADMVRRLRGVYPSLNIMLFDVFDYVEDATNHPEAYGLTNVKDACFTGKYYFAQADASNELLSQFGKGEYLSPALQDAYQVRGVETKCSQPDQYLYWDRVHPTTKMNKLLSQFVVKELRKNNVV